MSHITENTQNLHYEQHSVNAVYVYSVYVKNHTRKDAVPLNITASFKSVYVSDVHVTVHRDMTFM
jgi:hypothetical protein